MTTDSDRRLIVTAIAAIGILSLAMAAVLGALVILRLHSGDDFPPGIAAFLTAFVGLAGSAGALLAPSPLSKSSGSGDPQQVVGEGGGPVVVADAKKKG